MKAKKIFTVYSLITFAALLYGVGTVLFIFPNEVLLGGTSGIALLVSHALPVSPGTVSVIMNASLIVLAFFILGRGMALRTFIGSLLTTLFIGVFERVIPLNAPPVSNDFLASAIGAAIIALASAIMFYVDSSSGGTDIIALIIKKYVKVNVGTALLISDVLIVVIGGILVGGLAILYSAEGFLIKVLGIDLIIYLIRKITVAKQRRSV